MSAVPVFIPLLNPNEPEALLTALHVSEKQKVQAGDLLCTLETTKSSVEVRAEAEGFIIGLRVKEGQSLRAGEIFCYLADEATWVPPAIETLPSSHPSQQPRSAMEGLRITQPALQLAQEAGLDLNQLPRDQFITSNQILAHLEAQKSKATSPDSTIAFEPNTIIVYGGGGHGKSLIDLIRSLGIYQILGIVDDGIPAGGQVMGLPVLGGREVLPKLFSQGVQLAVNAVGGIGDISTRKKVFQHLHQAGFICPELVHPTALVEPSANLSKGVQVMPQAYIGSEAHLGFGVIVNSGAIVSHDCALGDYTNIAPGAILAGEVQVGEEVLIGMGVTVNLQVKIGAGARIGNGATIKANVPEKGIVKAGSVWPE